MGLWHMRNDFYSLFKSDVDHLKSIDGLRSLTCLMLIAVHIFGLLEAFIQPYPHKDWLDYVRSFSFSIIGFLTYSLEIFFMISGFLLTKKYLIILDETSDRHDFFKQYIVHIFRRACRYWPGIVLVWFMLLLLGEPKGNFMSVCLFYQNYFDIDHWSMSIFPLWSISFDMQMHLVMPLVLYIIYSYRKSFSMDHSLYILVILSIVYGLVTFNPTTMNVFQLISRHNSLGLLISESNEHWIKSHYNFTFPFEPIHPSPLKPFMHRMYLPLLSRYGSFLIGGILAVKLKNIKENRHTRIDMIKKYIYFVLIFIYTITFMLPRTEMSINNWLMTILMSIGRQIFATCQAFLLFSALSPTSHPYHSPWVKTILSLRFWSPIATLSYLIYVLHYRVVLDLVMGARWFSLEYYSIGFSVFLYLVMVFIICVPIALVWYIFVDKPCERFISRIFTRKRHDK